MRNKTYKQIKTSSPELNEMRSKTRVLLKEYHSLDFDDKEKKRSVLEQMFNSIGKMFL